MHATRQEQCFNMCVLWELATYTANHNIISCVLALAPRRAGQTDLLYCAPVKLGL